MSMTRRYLMISLIALAVITVLVVDAVIFLLEAIVP